MQLLQSNHNCLIHIWPCWTLLEENHIPEQFGANGWMHTGLVVYRPDVPNGQE